MVHATTGCMHALHAAAANIYMRHDEWRLCLTNQNMHHNGWRLLLSCKWNMINLVIKFKMWLFSYIIFLKNNYFKKMVDFLFNDVSAPLIHFFMEWFFKFYSYDKGQNACRNEFLYLILLSTYIKQVIIKVGMSSREKHAHIKTYNILYT